MTARVTDTNGPGTKTGKLDISTSYMYVEFDLQSIALREDIDIFAEDACQCSLANDGDSTIWVVPLR